MLVLQRYGASLQQIEVVVELLLVTYSALKTSGRQWRPTTDDLQAACLKRVTGRICFAEGLASALLEAAVHQVITNHPEPALLALAFGRLGDAGWLGIADDAHKYLVLAALNMVECVSQAVDRSTT